MGWTQRKYRESYSLSETVFLADPQEGKNTLALSILYVTFLSLSSFILSAGTTQDLLLAVLRIHFWRCGAGAQTRVGCM